MNPHKLRNVVVGVSLFVAVLMSAGSARADQGYPNPIVGPCNGSFPGYGEVYLFWDDFFQGNCWKVAVPVGANYAQISNVDLIGVPADRITSAIVGFGTEVHLYNDDYWRGTWWAMWNDGTPYDRDLDTNFGLAPGVVDFNDLMTSLTIFYR